MLGLGLGQTLRLNAVARPPNPNEPAAGCDAILSFADANGTPVGRGPGPTQINPGQAAFLDFPASLLVSTIGQRAEVRPTLRVESVAGMNACPGVVFLTETFDIYSMRTWAAQAPNMDKPPNPNLPAP
jgi:hypothetical protein